VALGAWFGWGLDDEKGRGDMRRGWHGLRSGGIARVATL
jgi:hypothetical protein